jgi:hypothetical protein
MTEQTFTFVVLPNGTRPSNRLGVSVLLTPRLSGAGTLASFPNVLHWPELVAAHGLTFELACDGRVETVPAPVAQLRSDIWSRIFTAQTFVEKHTQGDFGQRLFVSYPARSALAYLKYAYQTMGTTAFGGAGDRGLRTVLENLVFRDGPESTLDGELAQLRVELWREQQGTVDGPPLIKAADVRTATVPPDGVPAPLSQPSDTRSMITRFALFHHMPPAPQRPPLPNTAEGFAKLLDFHRALTALSSYPSLLRALGLVFDLEVPASLCPDSPQGATYGSLALQKVTPGFGWSSAPTVVLPSTAYVRDAARFAAAPATAPADVTSGNYSAGDVVDGVLALAPDGFHLMQVDLDGALLKALALADNLAFASDSSVVGDVLPALRSAGVSLVGNGRAMQILEAVRANTAFDDALTAGTALPRPFAAPDLTRGYRLDVWSSRTGQWQSLHRRDAVYRFGPAADVQLNVSDEEGFLHPAVAQPADDPTRPDDPVATSNGIPQPETDVFVHERIASWSGWSLSVTRPGGVLNRSPDPALATTPDPTVDEPLTPFKMTSSFTVRPGSLPELRFGRRYRIRARAVDLAGNSIALAAATPLELVAPAGGAQLPYLRFEPVPPPLVVLRAEPGAGGSLERLVIRSYNSSQSLDTAASTETDERHVAPPKTSVQLAELHGMLDDANGRLRGDQATYDLLVTRDRGTIPAYGGVPLEPGPQLAVSYLPDPIARGAALRDLPNAPDNADGHAGTGVLEYMQLEGVQPRAGSVTYVGFGPEWPARTAFRLGLTDGTAAPRWDDAEALLAVSIPKATVAEIELSSFFGEPDLELMGVWGWLRELFEAGETVAMAGSGADVAVTATSDVIALLTRLVLEGGHEMITPTRTLTLVHAVQQPLGRPAFTQLPVLHRPGDPILVSGLRNAFTPITAWRYRGSHSAVLLGGLEIHGASSSRIDVQATWREIVDDPSQARPTSSLQRDHVETIPLQSLDGGMIYSDASATRAVAVYVPKVDTLWFAAPFDELDGVATPSVVAAPQHAFPDTKHRWVAYRAVATSRFQEYFDTSGLDFTRTGEPLVVDVPSSARPTTPDLAYVVPTFGWQREETSNVKSSVRFGNGLRVYLRRPWYSSGPDELLGVLLWPSGSPPPDVAAREQFKPYFTQWGSDPIWASGDLEAVPGTWDFPDAKETASQLALDGTSLLVDVAGHEVGFDEARGLWYCDIQFSNGAAYAPFVRLALARYQPHSIDGVELSRAVLADFAQLAPTRSAVLTIDPADPRRARLFVGGLAPEGPTHPRILVTVERRQTAVPTDLGWEHAPVADVVVTEDSPAPSEPDAILWAGSIVFAQQPAPGSYRAVVREYELIEIDSPTAEPLVAERLVYAATLSYDYGSSM